MALTRLDKIGDGTTTVYDVDFDLGFISRGHVYVYLAENSYTEQLSYTWLNNTQIQLATPVTNGVDFAIRRVVPRDNIVNDYESGAILREKELDNSFKQAIMLLQEIEDGYIEVEGTFVIGGDLKAEGEIEDGAGNVLSEKMNNRPDADHLNIVVFDENGNSEDSGVSILGLEAGEGFAFTESKTLTDGQVDVSFNLLNPISARFVVCGNGVDSGTLCTSDYTVVDSSNITLASSYPTGTVLMGIQNEQTADIEKNVRYFTRPVTLAEAVANTNLQAGDTVIISDRGNGLFEYKTGQTPNGLNIIECTGVPSLSLVLQEKEVNVVQWGVIIGEPDSLPKLQQIYDLNPSADVFHPKGVYNLVTANSTSLIVREYTQTRLVGEAGTQFRGDTTLRPLLNYRGGQYGGFRTAIRGVEGIEFHGEWSYVAGVTDINDLQYNFKNGEGVLLAIGNDNVSVDKCSFYNSPALVLFESSALPSRVIDGRPPHVYGGSINNYRFRDCLYAIVAYADDVAGGQYVGSVSINDGFIGGVYKAVFAGTGRVFEFTFNQPTFEVTSMLMACQGHIDNIRFHNGHYELGWSKSQLTANQLPETLDFRDVFESQIAKYGSIPFWHDEVGDPTYDNYGYIDNSDGQSGLIHFDVFNRYYTFDQNTMVNANVFDEFSNHTDLSVIDATTLGDGSSINVLSLLDQKVPAGSIFSQPVPNTFSNHDGLMLRTNHFSNPSRSRANLAQAPYALGSNASGVTPSSFLADGVMGRVSVQYVINAAGALVFGYTAGYMMPTASAYVLYSMAIKVISTSDGEDATIAIDGVNVTPTEGALSPDREWKTFSLMLRGDQASRFWLKNGGANDVTLAVCDTQAVIFDTLTELKDYVGQGLFATRREPAFLDPLVDFITEITPTEEGYIVTLDHDWVSSSTVHHIFDSGSEGDMVGPEFEIERMEVKVISGTPVSLDIGSPTTSNSYYLTAYTPSGSSWVDIDLTNTRPPNATIAGSRMEIRPSVPSTVRLRFRMKIRIL